MEDGSSLPLAITVGLIVGFIGFYFSMTRKRNAVQRRPFKHLGADEEWFSRVVKRLEACGPLHHTKYADPNLKWRGRELNWEPAFSTEKDPLRMWYCLMGDSPLLVVPYHQRFFCLDGGILLLVGYGGEAGCFGIAVFKLDDLKPVNTEFPLPNSQDQYFAASAPTALISVPAGLEGAHSVQTPPELSEANEIFLFYSEPHPQPRAGGGRNETCYLYQIIPRENLVRVRSQDWFNEGNYDESYVAPSHAVRDPETGKVIGTGWRLGYFVMDETLRQVERWIRPQ